MTVQYYEGEEVDGHRIIRHRRQSRFPLVRRMLWMVFGLLAAFAWGVMVTSASQAASVPKPIQPRSIIITETEQTVSPSPFPVFVPRVSTKTVTKTVTLPAVTVTERVKAATVTITVTATVKPSTAATVPPTTTPAATPTVTPNPPTS